MNLQENLEVIKRNFNLTLKDIPKNLKSKHWNIFNKKFKMIFTKDYDWENFLNNQEGSTSIILWGKNLSNIKKKVISSSVKQNLINEYKRLKKKIGYKFIKKYHEGKIGNPKSLKYENLNINFRDIRSVYHAWKIKNILEKRKNEKLIFLEIGAGVGLLSVKLKKIFPNAKIISIDLPEVNCLQHYYHSKALSKSKIFDYQIFKKKGINDFYKNNYDFALLPAWVIGHIKNETVDMAINIHSMMEMNLETVNDYMNHINRTVKIDCFFYCINRYMKDNSNQPIKIKDYKFDDRWYLTISETSWQQYWIHELLAVRTGLPNVFPPKKNLSDLHPNSLKESSKYLFKIFLIIKNLIYTDDHRTYPNSLNILIKRLLLPIRSFLKIKTRIRSLFK